MTKIWAKIMIADKIAKSYELKIKNYDYHNFETYLNTICDKLDIPTPLILDKHIIDLTVYHNTKFVIDDFVETINFDKLVLVLF